MKLNTSNKSKPKRSVLKENLPAANKQMVLKPLDKYIAKLRGKFLGLHIVNRIQSRYTQGLPNAGQADP
jgi:hypothetical protein